MKSLGTYRKEYADLISIYAGLLFKYMKYEKEHAERDYEVAEIYVNKAGAEINAQSKIIRRNYSSRYRFVNY